MSETLTVAFFKPHIGKTVRVRGWQGTLILRSADTRAIAGWTPPTGDPFMLIFQGPRGDVLPEGTYTFDVDDGPEATFYLIPIHTPALTHQDYQAVFN